MEQEEAVKEKNKTEEKQYEKGIRGDKDKQKK